MSAKRPPVPADLDLHDFSFTPIFRAQLFASAFHATATSDEWKAGVTLWLKSWDQIPAGSLPDNDIQLAHLAEFGKDIEAWKVVKPMALRGWCLCSDGRLYHKVVTEGVVAAYSRRRAARPAPQQPTTPQQRPTQRNKSRPLDLDNILPFSKPPA